MNWRDDPVALDVSCGTSRPAVLQCSVKNASQFFELLFKLLCLRLQRSRNLGKVVVGVFYYCPEIILDSLDVILHPAVNGSQHFLYLAIKAIEYRFRLVDHPTVLLKN